MSFDNSKGQITEDRYGTDDKAQSLRELLTPYNVKIYDQYDIAVNQLDVPVPVKQDENGNILSLTIKRISRNDHGVIQYYRCV